MSARRGSIAAGLAVVVAGLAFVVSWVGLGFADRGSGLILLGTSAWFVVGALIVALRPGNAVGWVFSAVGLLWTSGLSLSAYAEWTDRTTGPWLTFVSWYAEWFWMAAIVLTIASMFLFPTGRVPSSRWRPALGAVLAGGFAGVLSQMLAPTVQASKSTPLLDNPIGVGALGPVVGGGAFSTAYGALLVCAAVAGLTSIVVRYRRSDGVERQQIKWMAIAVPLAVLGWVAAAALDSAGVRSTLLWLIPMIAIPAAAGISILRHQLYDVDKLISRTLVYGSLTALLGAAYVGLVLLGQAAFSSFAGGSNLAIAVSTLIVAALFLPLRSRVQHFVDRRFYRRRYDAQETLASFGARLRDQVDLTALAEGLTSAVDETMQPTHLSLWLRAGDGR